MTIDNSPAARKERGLEPIRPAKKRMHPARQAAISESLLEQSILELARLTGWNAHHVRDSRHVLMGDVGFPDWVYAKDGRVIIAELKSEDGKLSLAQELWLNSLGWRPESQWDQVWRLQVYVWRPSDWTSGAIERVFRAS